MQNLFLGGSFTMHIELELYLACLNFCLNLIFVLHHTSFSLLFKLHVYFFVHHFVALSYRATKETECQIPIYQLNMLLHKLLTELSQLDHIFMDQTMHCGSSWT